MSKKKRSWIAKLRITLWYCELSKRTGLTDYQLDLKYGVKEGQKVAGQDRPKIFERIRHKGNYAQSGLFRSHEEILQEISKDHNLSGLNDVYNSKFWDILEADQILSSVLYDELLKFMTCNNLEFIDLVESNAQRFSQKRMEALKITLSVLSQIKKVELLTMLSLLVDIPTYQTYIRDCLEDELQTLTDKVYDKDLAWVVLSKIYAELENKKIIRTEISDVLYVASCLDELIEKMSQPVIFLKHSRPILPMKYKFDSF